MLTNEQLESLRQVLADDKARLVKKAHEVLEYSMNRERNVGRDSIDESMEEELLSTELRLRDREKYLLSKIDGALTRLGEGTIDECEDCGDEIAYKRLLARPVTTLCIDCKQDREEAEQAQEAAHAPRGETEPPVGMGRESVAASPEE